MVSTGLLLRKDCPLLILTYIYVYEVRIYIIFVIPARFVLSSVLGTIAKIYYLKLWLLNNLKISPYSQKKTA